MGLPANLLNQPITHAAKSSRDAFGREVFGTTTNYKARVQQVSKSRFLPTGQVVNIALVVILDGNPSIDIDDKFTYGGADYKVYNRKVAVDGQGNDHHTTLECTKWQL